MTLDPIQPIGSKKGSKARNLAKLSVDLGSNQPPPQRYLETKNEARVKLPALNNTISFER